MNQKGGVGKTTTALNLGAALAQRGKKVLLIDLDPQANLTLGLGRRAADLSQSVYELLTDQKADAMKYVVETAWEGLHLVPSHIDLSGAEIEMVTMIGRETRLNKALARARELYDYILIDCLPSLSLLTVNAMAASNEVFVPLQAHPFALEGLGKLFEVVGMIREAMNPTLSVRGVLVTMFDGRTNVSKVTLETLRRDERLREHIFTTTIKQNIKVAESQKDGVPVIYYDTSCHASKAYMALAEEVLEMESGCLASDCADRITQREKKAGKKPLTFTPDLIAPHNPGILPDAEEKDSVPATSSEHAAPVSALVATPHKEEASSTQEPQRENIPPVRSDETPRTAAASNSPDVEALHPSSGFATGELSVEAAQAAQSGVAILQPSADINDETYRPRLALKPGSCKVPLPE
jgi:chromosome partitioning protein